MQIQSILGCHITVYTSRDAFEVVFIFGQNFIRFTFDFTRPSPLQPEPGWIIVSSTSRYRSASCLFFFYHAKWPTETSGKYPRNGCWKPVKLKLQTGELPSTQLPPARAALSLPPSSETKVYFCITSTPLCPHRLLRLRQNYPQASPGWVLVGVFAVSSALPWSHRRHVLAPISSFSLIFN